MATRLLLLACLVPQPSAWTVPSSSSSSRSGIFRGVVGRREALSSAAAAAAVFAPSLPAFAAKLSKKEALNENLVLILRVQEATGQETRLVKTGKYKELQRLDIKRAIVFMLHNYSLRDRFVAASAFAPLEQQQKATDYAQTAVESLIQITEYFPDKLKANDLTREQSSFVLSALSSTSKSIDAFLELMPPEAVSRARQQIDEENSLNQADFDDVPSAGEIVNKDKTKPKPPPPPPVEPPPPADALQPTASAAPPVAPPPPPPADVPPPTAVAAPIAAAPAPDAPAPTS